MDALCVQLYFVTHLERNFQSTCGKATFHVYFWRKIKRVFYA